MQLERPRCARNDNRSMQAVRAHSKHSYAGQLPWLGKTAAPHLYASLPGEAQLLQPAVARGPARQEVCNLQGARLEVSGVVRAEKGQGQSSSTPLAAQQRCPPSDGRRNLGKQGACHPQGYPQVTNSSEPAMTQYPPLNGRHLLLGQLNLHTLHALICKAAQGTAGSKPSVQQRIRSGLFSSVSLADSGPAHADRRMLS